MGNLAFENQRKIRADDRRHEQMGAPRDVRSLSRHPRAGGNPAWRSVCMGNPGHWIPACAGMTNDIMFSLQTLARTAGA
ncbi:MAG TPA: hypothetical protein EYH41_08160 [Novosphingobium capsulatum]|nr:hypothetical protein [Novosphingobium capsulatum]